MAGSMDSPRHAEDDCRESSWDFEKVISLPEDLKSVQLFCVDKQRLIFGDTYSGLAYSVHLVTEKITKQPLQSDVMDCALLSDGTLCASEYSAGCIGVYDESGKRVREINLIGVQSPCHLAIAAGPGRYLTAGSVAGGSNIVHIVDPMNAKLVRAGSIDADEIRGEIQVTSSGLIVVKSVDDQFAILDGETARVRSNLKSARWRNARCAVDPSTDALYVCYTRQGDRKGKAKEKGLATITVVDEFDIDGRERKVAALEYKQLTSPVIAPLVTKQGQMIVYNGKELLVYNKTRVKGIKPAKKWVKV